jgi:hypothetical protein
VSPDPLKEKLRDLVVKWRGQAKRNPIQCGWADMCADELEQALAAQPEPQSDHESHAKAFHEAYERLAPQFGYETRKESAVPWSDVPENNRKLMIAVCRELFSRAPQPEPGETREWKRLSDWQRDFAIRALRCYKESYARNGTAFEDDIESTIEALAAGEKRVSDTSVT